MRAWFACKGSELLASDPEAIVGELAKRQQRFGYSGSTEQDFAWTEKIPALQAAIAEAQGKEWTVALEFELTRLERRIDAVILTDRAIICCEFKTAAPSRQGLREVDEYALRLRDFHAGSRGQRIVPLLVAGPGDFAPPHQGNLDLVGMMPACATGTSGLGTALRWIQDQFPAPSTPIDRRAWLEAAYEPVPSIIEAARRLFARHDVVELGLARADPGNLTRTNAAIARAIDSARRDGKRVVIFVTGIPGAGKTLCGLNTVFRSNAKAAFLTGNSPLVAVLRGALLKDALDRHRRDASRAEEEIEGFIQDVHKFFRQHVRGGPPPEEVIVFDEAQRAWDEKKATRPSQNRKTELTMSEPAHALEIMARRLGWSAIVALIGNGQEINTGEAGLSEWGRAIEAHGGWQAVAAPRALRASDPLQRLVSGPRPWLTEDEELDLVVPIRAIRNGMVADWVAAVLDNDAETALRLATGSELPIFITRDLERARAALRDLARGERRSGFVRSAGAKRLRGDGLAAEVSRLEVADWFLASFPPDVRASNALESAATEYACQGLELDVVGLAWHLDFRRDGSAWSAYAFGGTKWRRDEAEFHYVRNTYRVLLTRARYETVIWVPWGSRRGSVDYDETRDAAALDRIADFLLACGARPIETAPVLRPPEAATLL